MIRDYLKNYSDLNLLLRVDYPTDTENVFVDVGAFRGGFTSAFARRGWRVIAFEPEPRNYALLTQRVNKYPNVTCIQKAVTDKSGESVPFYVDQTHPARNSLQPVSADHQTSIDIQTTRLDDVLMDHKLKEVTLLKIDAEGADFQVLKGFDFNKIKPDLVMAEFDEERTRQFFNYDLNDIVTYMEPYNYQVFIIETRGRERWDFNYQVGSTQYKLERIGKYPFRYDPKMGNIVFVQKQLISRFENAYQSYLSDLNQFKYIRIPIQLLRQLLIKIPYARDLFYTLRRILSIS